MVSAWGCGAKFFSFWHIFLVSAERDKICHLAVSFASCLVVGSYGAVSLWISILGGCRGVLVLGAWLRACDRVTCGRVARGVRDGRVSAGRRGRPAGLAPRSFASPRRSSSPCPPRCLLLAPRPARPSTQRDSHLILSQALRKTSGNLPMRGRRSQDDFPQILSPKAVCSTSRHCPVSGPVGSRRVKSS